MKYRKIGLRYGKFGLQYGNFSINYRKVALTDRKRGVIDAKIALIIYTNFTQKKIELFNWLNLGCKWYYNRYKIKKIKGSHKDFPYLSKLNY